MKLPLETTAHGKWYDDACGTAFALELVGERWSLLIVRELMLGPRRFSDLRAGLPAISAKVLSQRLAGLERAGVLVRRTLPLPAGVQVYELTAWGYAADEAIMALGRWAAASPMHDPTLPLSAVSLMMSFRTMFDPGRAGDLSMTGTITVGEQPFIVAVAGRALEVSRGQPEASAFAITAPSAEPIAALVHGKVPPDELAGAGLVIAGDQALAMRFADLFAYGAKAGS